MTTTATTGEGGTSSTASSAVTTTGTAGSGGAATSSASGTGGAATTGTTGTGSGCGNPVGSTWAQWPMPNPPSTGLPNPASYDVSTPGIVVDKVTGLTWQRDVDAKTYTWADAKAYCASLVLEGACPWRLPTRIELVSILDNTHVDPAIDSVAFPATPPERYWSSSPSQSFPGSNYVWYVNFGAGDAYFFDGSTDLHRVRCVR
jgi:hypothetical protein